MYAKRKQDREISIATNDSEIDAVQQECFLRQCRAVLTRESMVWWIKFEETSGHSDLDSFCFFWE